MRVPIFSTLSPSLRIVNPFHFSHSTGCEIIFKVALICISPKSNNVEYVYICVWVQQSLWSHFQMRIILKDHCKKVTMKLNTIIHAYHPSAFPLLHYIVTFLFCSINIWQCLDTLCQNFSGQARTSSLPLSPLEFSELKQSVKIKA